MTLPKPVDISLLFGTLNFVTLDSSSSEHSNTSNDLSIEQDSDDFVFIEKQYDNTSHFNQMSASLPIQMASRKNFLWQLEYKSVPYYIRTYNQYLYVCDKYGTVLLIDIKIILIPVNGKVKEILN